MRTKPADMDSSNQIGLSAGSSAGKSQKKNKSRLEETSSVLHRGTLRIRLIIAGPLFVGLLVLLAGVFILRIAEIKMTNAGVPQANINNIKAALELTILGFTVIAGFAGFLLSYVIVKPVRQMTETARNIATGKLTQTDSIPSHVEIDTLQATFNNMVTSLRDFSYERNKYILESLAGALVTLDSTGKITTINTAAESILGVEIHSVTGKSIFEILEDVPENQQVRRMFQNSLQSHVTYSSEEVILSSSTIKKLPIGITISLLKEENQLIGIVATFKDLSKIKQIHQQLQRSDRLAAIGTLATGLAHEIRNPLGSMRGLAQLLAEDMKPEDPKLRYAQVIIKEIDRLNHVVQELLTFSQASSGGMEHNDINIALRDALFIAKQNPKVKPNITVTEYYDTQIPLVKIEKEKLIQAFLNIIMNGLEVAGEMPGNESKLDVRTSLSNPRPDYPVPNLGFALVEISNTGKAIPPEHLDRIFDPFFTTKESGTGLGLAIVHQIIASHSGLIEVSSEPGKGTVFRIYIPIIKEQEASELATV
jgi:PAS domain S-box-containing protein